MTCDLPTERPVALPAEAAETRLGIDTGGGPQGPRQACCTFCHTMQTLPVEQGPVRYRCRRCGAEFPSWPVLMRRARLSHALAVCGILLLLPAYFLPMLTIEQFVERTEAGLVVGVLELFQRGEWLLAAVIGLFSGVLPIVKLMGLVVVSSSWAVERCHAPTVYARLRRICHLVEGTGRLGMLEVFVVAIIVFAFRASATFDVAVKPGTAVFLLLVLITMLAGHCFDPRVYGSAFDDQRI